VLRPSSPPPSKGVIILSATNAFETGIDFGGEADAKKAVNAPKPHNHAAKFEALLELALLPLLGPVN